MDYSYSNQFLVDKLFKFTLLILAFHKCLSTLNGLFEIDLEIPFSSRETTLTVFYYNSLYTAPVADLIFISYINDKLVLFEDNILKNLKIDRIYGNERVNIDKNVVTTLFQNVRKLFNLDKLTEKELDFELRELFGNCRYTCFKLLNMFDDKYYKIFHTVFEIDKKLLNIVSTFIKENRYYTTAFTWYIINRNVITYTRELRINTYYYLTDKELYVDIITRPSTSFDNILQIIYNCLLDVYKLYKLFSVVVKFI